jgi:hypothetical protein
MNFIITVFGMHVGWDTNDRLLTEQIVEFPRISSYVSWILNGPVRSLAALFGWQMMTRKGSQSERSTLLAPIFGYLTWHISAYFEWL